MQEAKGSQRTICGSHASIVVSLLAGMVGSWAVALSEPLIPMVVDGGPDAQGFSAVHALDHQPFTGHPAVAGLNGVRRDIVYARYDGAKWNSESAWRFPSLVSPVHDSAFALAHDPSSGEPRILFTGFGNTDLHVLIREGGIWTHETITSQGNSPANLDLLVDPSTGRLWIFWDVYHNGTSVPLYGTAEFFAERTGVGAYGLEMIEKSVTMLSNHTNSARIDPTTGEPCVAYLYLPGSSESSAIRFARRSGGVWNRQNVVTGVWATSDLCLTFAKRGAATVPQIADKTTGYDIKVHYLSGGSWATETASTTAYESQIRGFQTNAQTGLAVLLYMNMSGNVVVTYHTGSAWSTFTVGSMAYNGCLAIAPDGTLTVTNVEQVGTHAGIGYLHTYRGPLGSLTKSLAIPWLDPGKSLCASFRPGTDDLWVAYVDAKEQQLLLAHWTGWEFAKEVVAPSGVTDGVTLLWPTGAEKPWIVYARNGGVALARHDSGGYATETLAAAGTRPSAALDPATDEVVAAFLDGSSLRLARRDSPSSVSVETLPAAGNADGLFQPRVAFHPLTGNPAVLHMNGTGSVGVAVLQKVDGVWQDEVVGGSVPKIANLVFDPAYSTWLVSIAQASPYSSTSDINQYRWSGSSWNELTEIYQEPGNANYIYHDLALHPVSGRMVCVARGIISGTQNLFLTERTGAAWSSPSILAESPAFGSLDAVDAVFTDTGAEAYFAHDSSDSVLRVWMTSDQLLPSAAHSWTHYQ